MCGYYIKILSVGLGGRLVYKGAETGVVVEQVHACRGELGKYPVYYMVPETTALAWLSSFPCPFIVAKSCETHCLNLGGRLTAASSHLGLCISDLRRKGSS